MNIQSALIENFQDLTLEQQKVVLELVKFLKYQQQIQPPSGFSFLRLWADLNFSVTSEDQDPAREEMWGKFAEGIEI